MPHLGLFLLGTPRIERAGVPIEVDTRKATALVVYLAVTGESHSRDQLATLFWPESDQSHARTALRSTLSILNKALGGVGLAIDREGIGLDPTAEVWLDVYEFRRRLAACRTHGHPDSDTCAACLPMLSEAVALYRDDFLTGFSLSDCPDFDEWQFFQTESLRRELAGALERLVHYHSTQNEFEPAITYARRWLALDPLHEPAHRRLMQLYAWAGQRAAALRQYRECVRVLEQELGVSPLEETTQLYQSIKENRVSPPIVKTGQPPSPAETVSRESGDSEARVRQFEYPLVGRSQEWTTVLRAYQDHGANGYFLVLEGEAGIGKTRLAEELLTQAQARGAMTIVTRCYEGEANLAYSPFIEGLRAVTLALVASGRAGQSDRMTQLQRIATHWLSEAARLVPEWATLFPGLSPAPPMEGPGAQSRFFEGLRQVLMETCRGSPPGILYFDDLHWADAASLDLLTYLIRRLRGHPLFILATWRSEGVPPDHRLRQLATEAQRADTGALLPLSRLSLSDVADLVQSVVSSGVALPEGLSARLHRETEGLPLFVVEYLATMITGTPENWSMPHRVRDLLHERLAIVGETGRQLLQTAAVIGRSFDLDTLREASGRSDEETVTALEKLVAHRLIRELTPGDAAQTPAYDFSHQKLRELIYEETSLARRRLLHQRVANALVMRGRRHRQIGTLASQIAYHYQMAGQASEAAEHFWLAGEHARSLYANVEALTHYGAALSSGYSDAAQLHEVIGDLHTLSGQYRSALSSYETAAALRHTNGQHLARIEHKIGNVCQRQGERHLSETHYQIALDLLDEAADPGTFSKIYTDWSLAAHHQGQAVRAVELARRALEFADASGDKRALAQAHNVLGVLARHREDYEMASQHLQQSLIIAEETGDLIGRVAALNNRSLVCGDQGDIDRAVSLAEQALAACATLGDRHREAALHNNLADVLHQAGKPEAAMSHLKQAVTIFAEIGVESGDWQPEIWKLTEW